MNSTTLVHHPHDLLFFQMPVLRVGDQSWVIDSLNTFRQWFEAWEEMIEEAWWEGKRYTSSETLVEALTRFWGVTVITFSTVCYTCRTCGCTHPHRDDLNMERFLWVCQQEQPTWQVVKLDGLIFLPAPLSLSHLGLILHELAATAQICLRWRGSLWVSSLEDPGTQQLCFCSRRHVFPCSEDQMSQLRTAFSRSHWSSFHSFMRNDAYHRFKFVRTIPFDYLEL